MKNKRELIVNGNLLKAILFTSLPLMINNFVVSSYNVIDTIFVSRIGQMELAVVAFVSPINQMMVAISLGLSIAGTSLIGYSVGGEDYQKANNTTSHLFMLSMFLGIGLAVVLFFSSAGILQMASATESIMAIGNKYLRLLILSMPLIFFNSFYVAVKRGYGETLHIMNIQLFSMAVKIVLNYYLIIVLKKGIEALAIATLVGNAVMTIYACFDMYAKNKKPIMNLKKTKLTASIFLSIFLVSLPSILEKASTSFSFIVINDRVLEYGENVLAAYGITNRINSMFFGTIAGLGSGLATLISQNLGANKLQRVKKSIKMSMGIGAAFSVIFLVIIFLLAPMFSNLLAGKGTELNRHIINAIHGYSASIIPWVAIQVTIGVFIGISKTKYNLLLSAARIYVFRLPCIILLARFTQLQEYSVWYGMIISNTLTAVFAIILLKIIMKSVYENHNNLSSSV